MGFLTNLLNFLKELATKRGISETFFIWLIFMFSIQGAVLIHEFGHFLVANLLGCKAVVLEANFYIGATGFSCPEDWSEEKLASTIILIALAGPITSFLVGLYFWFLEEDALIRLAGLILWLYSTLPNLYVIRGSDMWVAIQYGLHPIIATIIYLFVTALVGVAIVKEIIDRKFLFEKEWV